MSCAGNKIDCTLSALSCILSQLVPGISCISYSTRVHLTTLNIFNQPPDFRKVNMSNVISIPLQVDKLFHGQFIHHFATMQRYQVIKVDADSIKVKNLTDLNITIMSISEMKFYEWCMIMEDQDE